MRTSSPRIVLILHSSMIHASLGGKPRTSFMLTLPTSRQTRSKLMTMKLPKCANSKCKKRVKEVMRTYCSVKCFRKSIDFKIIRSTKSHLA
jgi:hypothetical protein